MRKFLILCFVTSIMTIGSAWAGGKVDINTASAKQLQTIIGIGAKTAAAIIVYREAHGSFKTTGDLVHVRGIGKKKFSKMEDDLEVSDDSDHENTHEDDLEVSDDSDHKNTREDD